MKRIYVSLITIITVAAIVISAIIILEELRQKRFSAFVVYSPYEIPNRQNPEQKFSLFLADLDLVKDMGFDGVKLHDVWNFWNDSLLDQAVTEMANRDLKVIIQFYCYDAQLFPQNTSRTDDHIRFFRSAATILKDNDNVLWYALFYPWHWPHRYNYIENNLTSSAYQWELQRIIDDIKEVDPETPIYLVSQSIEYYGGDPPHTLTKIVGFGYHPYSRETNNIQADDMIREYYNYWKGQAKTRDLGVYIDEWGVQTEKSKKEGFASSEDEKADMIADFVDYIYTWDIVWCYFALHDTSESDWGLVYADNTLKKSGEIMKNLLND
jgi:hypothetical protein